MKTRKYIIFMVIALIFGIVTIHAQPVRRGHAQGNKRNTRITQPARQTQKPHVQHQQSTKQYTQHVQNPRVRTQRGNSQTVHQVQRPYVQHQQSAKQHAQHVQNPRTRPQQETTQPVRRVQNTRTQPNRNTGQTQRSVRINSSNNSRSTYKKTNSKVYVDHNHNVNSRVNIYSGKPYYSGHYYHYVYPAGKVKFHYHHDTYVHNYHVLYYPTYTNIYWSRNMYIDFHRWYPKYYWRYSYGYRIHTISAFDAKYNLGELVQVYGRIYSTWYNVETDDYLLFFGGEYPYQQFTVVLPGYVARRFSWRPENYFLGEHLTVTGLITTFDGKPEIIVKNKRQVRLY